MIYTALHGVDSSNHFYLHIYDDTHNLMGCISYFSCGINWSNESLLGSMLFDPFSFDSNVYFKFVECSKNTHCQFYDFLLL